MRGDLLADRIPKGRKFEGFIRFFKPCFPFGQDLLALVGASSCPLGRQLVGLDSIEVAVRLCAEFDRPVSSPRSSTAIGSIVPRVTSSGESR